MKSFNWLIMLCGSFMLMMSCKSKDLVTSPNIITEPSIPLSKNQTSVLCERWQQHATYKMEIDMDVTKHQYQGKQWLSYTNNSPDDLDKVFYHLYFNAFQPGSMMDERSRTIKDPDPRVGDRIFKLSENEIGYQNITKLTLDGVPVKYMAEGTILEVELPKTIEPGMTVELYMEFDAQIPLQIRRSGRDNKEGISYSMTQWYPKLCEYDYQGWHSNPYIGREFHGIWGEFDVSITIASDYILGGTGTLVNAKSLGYGQSKLKSTSKPKRTWHFQAEKVHDFAWGADPDYNHLVDNSIPGLEVHYLYQDGDLATENWPILPNIMSEAFKYLSANYGQYPYNRYSFIQGGDGGMEYPMATLITGERKLSSLVGVSVHELVHSWYQMILGTNEALYGWMDEGFTSYVSAQTMNHLRKKGLIPGDVVDDPMLRSVTGFARFATTGYEEPLSTHADHFQTNRAYGVGSYTKGSVFLAQLNYIIGAEKFNQGMLDYFETWKFKHPNANDFIRVMEKTSGFELDWYKEYMVNTTHTIDYAVDTVFTSGNTVNIGLEKIGAMPMPVDFAIYFKNGTTKLFTAPLRMMRASKSYEKKFGSYKVLPDWPWTHANYDVIIEGNLDDVERIVVDPFQRIADTDPSNNIWPRVEKVDEK